MTESRVAAIGQALVDFALYGSFPDEEVSAHRIGVDDFGPALEALAAAKSKLEVNSIGF
jgi:protein transport protein DSL1/ZW10